MIDARRLQRQRESAPDVGRGYGSLIGQDRCPALSFGHAIARSGHQAVRYRRGHRRSRWLGSARHVTCRFERPWPSSRSCSSSPARSCSSRPGRHPISRHGPAGRYRRHQRPARRTSADRFRRIGPAEHDWCSDGSISFDLRLEHGTGMYGFAVVPGGSDDHGCPDGEAMLFYRDTDGTFIAAYSNLPSRSSAGSAAAHTRRRR